MKKIACILFAVLLIPFVAGAQEKSLYETADHLLLLTDAVVGCAAGHVDCSEEDIAYLKVDVELCRNDLIALAKSGNLRNILLTSSQARQLLEKARVLRAMISKIQVFDGICNVSVYYIYKALGALGGVFYLLLVILPLLAGTSTFFLLLFVVLPLYFILSLFVGVAEGLIGLLLSPACLFWWL